MCFLIKGEGGDNDYVISFLVVNDLNNGAMIFVHIDMPIYHRTLTQTRMHLFTARPIRRYNTDDHSEFSSEIYKKI